MKSDFEKAIRYLIVNTKQSKDINYKEFFELCVQIAKNGEVTEEYAKLYDNLMELFSN